MLVCHALTGDQHVANRHPVTGAEGWWKTMIGPGRPIDTDRFFVICANVLGGCMGTTGPASTNLATGKPWALDFPLVTVRDMVRAQAKLLDRLGIDSLFSVLGGSMGGMQVLQWAASYPDRVFSALPIATAAKHSAAEHRLSRGRPAGGHRRSSLVPGRYAEAGTRPSKGLGVARMAAHITYLSEQALHRKFGRNLQDRCARDLLLRRRFPGEELSAPPGHELRRALRRKRVCLHHPRHGLFDLAADYGGVLARAFQNSKTRFCVVSFTSDLAVRYFGFARHGACARTPPASSVSFVEIKTDKGHDAFLLDEPEFFTTTAASSTRPPARGASGDEAMNMVVSRTRLAPTRVDLLTVA